MTRPGFYPWGMHPYQFRSWHRGPSRLLWFAIGGFTTAAVIRHRDERAKWCGDAHIAAGPHHQPPTMADANAPAAVNASNAGPWQWRARWGNGSEGQKNMHATWEENQRRQWTWDEQMKKLEEDKERVREWGKHADQKMVDFSESALESVMATAEALKQKIAERKAQREAEVQHEIELLEQAKKMPPRMV